MREEPNTKSRSPGLYQLFRFSFSDKVAGPRRDPVVSLLAAGSQPLHDCYSQGAEFTQNGRHWASRYAISLTPCYNYSLTYRITDHIMIKITFLESRDCNRPENLKSPFRIIPPFSKSKNIVDLLLLFIYF